MGLLSILLLTVGATTDSFAIGFNYGIKQVRIGTLANLFISFLCLLGTFAAMGAGRLLGYILPGSVADLLGSAALIGFGVYMLISALRPQKCDDAYSDPTHVDKDGSKIIELRESLLVGLLLCVNNVGLGIGAGIAGVSLLLTPPLCAAANFIFIKAGCRLGDKLSGTRIAKILELLSALLILVLGLIGLL